jgi:hypothetical protein
MTAREFEAALDLVCMDRRKTLAAMLLAASDGLWFVAVPTQTFASTNGIPIRLKWLPSPAQRF